MNEFFRRLVVLASRLSGEENLSAYRDDFDACAPTYDSVVTRPLLAAETERLIGTLRLMPGMRCADLGCGTGHSSAAIIQKILPGGRLSACDFSPAMVLAARDRLAGKESADIIQADMADFLAGFPEGAFDFIGSFWSLEYRDPGKVLRECFRALKGGGELAVLVNLRSSLMELQDLVTPVIMHNPLSLKRIPPLAFIPDLAAFEKTASRAGFEPLELAEKSLAVRFNTGAHLVRWMREGGPSAGFRSSLRESRRDAVYDLIGKEADKRGGLEVVFRYVSYRGRRP